MALAERMGLEGEELRAWLDEQEARARDERAAEREARKELLELEERRERNLQLQLKVAESESNPESTVTQNTSLAIETTDQCRLEPAERLSTDVIYYAPAHAYGTAMAPIMQTERTGYLRAVGTEDLRGHGESVMMKPTKLPVLYFQRNPKSFSIRCIVRVLIVGMSMSVSLMTSLRSFSAVGISLRMK
ncbi:hypothetical protein HPB50_008075 [Hyalomma asiaticum]|uniref:Uncharacterized protein n=1 Tax=Hyalomma asiaticum TaxID=266040 RepID=A0ACB7RXK7_HYAAI|nr:hypothetical protein HPB50_008075 [Hyalomma asiaticum]